MEHRAPPDRFRTESLHLFVLWSLAVAQPLFDLLSRNAEFFVARRSEPGDIAVFILFVCVLLPACFVLLSGILRWLGRRAPLFQTLQRWTVNLLLISFVAAIALQALHRLSALPGLILVAGAFLVAVLTTISYRRFLPVRTFVSMLFPALLLFPGLFSFASPVFHVILPSQAPLGPEVKVESTTPVVMVIFDELPLTALMDEQRQIDAVRYPHFAALAQTTTWFRNTTTVADTTLSAVPAILSGIYPDQFRLPRAKDYPRNLFTLLGGAYELKVSETFTQLCPERLCGSGMLRKTGWKTRLASLGLDLSIVYLHLLLPEDLRSGLPTISQDWMNFAGNVATPQGEAEKKSLIHKWIWEDLVSIEPPHNRPHKFFHFLDSIRPVEQPTLYYLHINLPHPPFIWLPSGKNYLFEAEMPGLIPGREEWEQDEWAAIQGYQRHLLQIGYADKLLGQLLERLKSADLYDRCLLVVTSDHGASYRPGNTRRYLHAGNVQDILPVPLFMKTPAQHEGAINDSRVETIDILPTIADVLDIDLAWPLDGHSVWDGSVPQRTHRTLFRSNTAHERLRFETQTLEQARDKALKRKLAIFGSGKTRPNGLLHPYAELPDLMYKNIREIDIRAEASVSVTLYQAGLFAMVEPTSQFIPAHITGQVRDTENVPSPIQLAIAVNGSIQAITRPWSFPVKGETGRWSAIVDETVFRSGHNDVQVFLVSRVNGQPVLERTRLDQTYVLTSSDGPADARVDSSAETLTSPTGVSLPLIPQAIHGKLEYARIKDDFVAFSGWAVDEKNEQLPEAIVMFVNGQFAYAGQTTFNRPGVVKRFGNQALEKSGFYFSFPTALFIDKPDLEVRFFGVSKKGKATELEYKKSYQWRK
jgi:hypothetical protein